MSRKRQYTTIGIPKELYDRINRYIEENPELGYTTATEFIKEAIRQYIRKIIEEKED